MLSRPQRRAGRSARPSVVVLVWDYMLYSIAPP